MLDLACSLALLTALVTLVVAYGVRVLRAGAARFERVERTDRSVLVGKVVLEMAYWMLTPLAHLVARSGITAVGVTWTSLALGLGAGAALAAGHFGLGALLTTLSGLGDAIDGLVARHTGSASQAGEVLDSAADRYTEFFFLAGAAVFYRTEVVPLALALFALLGSFMVSYATAKSEALRVRLPPGAMRRHARSLYLGAGAWFTPLLAQWPAARALTLPRGHLAMLAVLTLVAVVANVSAIRRLAFLGAAVRARRAGPREFPAPDTPAGRVAREP